MPELPEVETTRRGLAPHLQGRRVHGVILRRADLRWPIPPEVAELLPGSASRTSAAAPSTCCWIPPSAARCCTWACPAACACCPVIPAAGARPRRHQPGQRPPAALQRPAPLRQPALAAGRRDPPAAAGAGPGAPGRCLRRRLPVRPQPGPQCAGEDLPDGPGGGGGCRQHLRRREPVQGRHQPLREAGKISRERYQRLADAVKEILGYAITRGGTTLRDFISPDGAPGYFEQELLVYGRDGLPCPNCGRALKHATIGQRASVWCSHCQR